MKSFLIKRLIKTILIKDRITIRKRDGKYIILVNGGKCCKCDSKKEAIEEKRGIKENYAYHRKQFIIEDLRTIFKIRARG